MCVFSAVLNDRSDEADRMANGKLFHIRGAAHENRLEVVSSLYVGTTSWLVVLDRSCRAGSYRFSMDARYAGWPVCRNLLQIGASLNRIRFRNCSQCSLCSSSGA